MSVDHDDGQRPDLATPAAVVGEFVKLAQELLEASTVHAVLDRVVTATVAVVPGADLASVTLRAPDGKFDTPVATSPTALTLDEVQYDLGEGPCLEASRTPGQGMVATSDLRASDTFPRWGPAAVEHGVHSVLALGLFLGQEPARMGALNIYSTRPDGLDRADRDIALILAAHATTALAGTLATAAADLQNTQLREALRSRDVIGQAKGILMERRGVDQEAAFDILRSASQSLNIKLVRVAETVAQRRAEL
jgi:hypothetical protein